MIDAGEIMGDRIAALEQEFFDDEPDIEGITAAMVDTLKRRGLCPGSINVYANTARAMLSRYGGLPGEEQLLADSNADGCKKGTIKTRMIVLKHLCGDDVRPHRQARRVQKK